MVPGDAKEVRILQNADDTTLVTTHEHTIPIILDICKQYGKASGAKLNVEKSCGL